MGNSDEGFFRGGAGVINLGKLREGLIGNIQHMQTLQKMQNIQNMNYVVYTYNKIQFEFVFRFRFFTKISKVFGIVGVLCTINCHL